jgi:hypothetical protein
MSRFRNRVAAQVLGIGQDILVTQLGPVTGTISAQLGDATAGVPDIDEAQWTQTCGIWSLPAAPTPNAPINGGIAAQAVTIKCGNRDVVIGVRDVRTNNRYGNLAPGDTCLGASSGMASVFCKAADGSVTMATSDTNDRTGNSMFLKLAPTEFRFWAPFGSQLQDKTGFHLRTWTGAKLDIGGSGLPAPFSSLGLNSSFVVSADIINLSGALVSIGKDAGFTQAVVQALPLQVVLTTVATALSDVSTTLGTINACVGSLVPATGVTTAQIAAVSAATTACASAISAAATALATVNAPAASAGCATNTTIA